MASEVSAICFWISQFSEISNETQTVRPLKLVPRSANFFFWHWWAGEQANTLLIKHTICKYRYAANHSLYLRVHDFCQAENWWLTRVSVLPLDKYFLRRNTRRFTCNNAYGSKTTPLISKCRSYLTLNVRILLFWALKRPLGRQLLSVNRIFLQILGHYRCKRKWYKSDGRFKIETNLGRSICNWKECNSIYSTDTS